MGNCVGTKVKKIHPKNKSKTDNCNPLIVRMINKPKYRKKNIPKSLKKMVWDTYIGPDIGKAKCMCCKHQDIRQIEFHCGHIIAEVNGGQTNVDNLRPICAQCNLSMGRTDMNSFIIKFMSES